MNDITILAIVGSLRSKSFNRQLALQAQRLCGEHVHFKLLDYQMIPFMNEDLEHPAPASIQRIREEVEAADGIWFFTPEYNHSYPGVLKNLLDWLSRPDEQGTLVLHGKPAAISGISPGMSGTLLSQDLLVMLLSFLNMKIMNLPRLTIPNAHQQVKDDTLILKESLPYLQKQYDAFISYIRQSMGQS